MPTQFYSTNDRNNVQPLREAVLRSLPADRGLYMPEEIRPLPESFWQNWRDLSLGGLGFEVTRHLLQGTLPEEELKALVEEAINFPAPLHQLTEDLSVLELFHGPTLAFKDFGARFMARLMGFLTKDDGRDLTVLVATSGDTGGAVASAFHKVPGTKVVILYPKGGVSGLQEKQLTTLGDNITALEVAGTFDDCQRLVKAAFADRELSERLNLTSANSINISRLIPQSFYYFEAARQVPEGQKPTFIVPSGNFGNLTAGLLAQRLGLPVEKFVAATNTNDVVPRYLMNGNYEPRPSVATISNAMDVGAPSNFARMVDLFARPGNPTARTLSDADAADEMARQLEGLAYTDKATRQAIREVWENYRYALCPHTAVAYLAAKDITTPGHKVILSTAHPSKFLPTMEEELGKGAVTVPERLACLAEEKKVAQEIEPDEATFLTWLG
ncbi:threonine synthase [Roseibacillus ishigakijimensis]|uniref:Threonine synthase n=1 Tax=Roseibacillus ishigakijimensis TaxID=454146 RepID=A0A934VLN6_9BACT|nr:threonine synthase [Roseibacillus ishigakijimensis]MBK1834874.1 threonine synthase [Roseibacillus ishigakijimensis]